jgi:thiol:disulfide interchange protein DsbD
MTVPLCTVAPAWADVPDSSVPSPAHERPAAAAPALEFVSFDEHVFTAAQRSGEPFVLYFEADWCLPCKEMKARTFVATEVLEAATGTRLLSVDITEPGRYVRLIQESFEVVGAPMTIFFGPDGKERHRRFGFIPPKDYARLLTETRAPAKGS